MTTNEVYKIVKDNPKYEVSNHGNVRTFNNYFDKYYDLSPIRMKSGGYKVNLGDNSRYRFTPYYVNRLVASHFMDDFDSKKPVYHLDKDSSNNHIDNLYQA